MKTGFYQKIYRSRRIEQKNESGRQPFFGALKLQYGSLEGSKGTKPVEE